MNQATVPALVIRRTFEAPPQAVFAAWTTPAMMMQFLAPEDGSIKDIKLDVRPGGAYTVVFGMPDGEDWTVGGVYKEVSPPNRLSMTWRWVEDDPKDERDTFLSLQFNPHGSGTELVLTHENLRSEESRESHDSGWNAFLDKLAATLS